MTNSKQSVVLGDNLKLDILRNVISFFQYLNGGTLNTSLQKK